MFCLRSWIPILFFLTNASPVYLVLFISATYILNRPCVYCSLLLFVLVIALFDFRTGWFEPPNTATTTSSSAITDPASPSSTSPANATDNSLLSSTSPPSHPALETASLLASLANATASAAVRAAVEGVKRKVAALGSGAGVASGVEAVAAAAAAAEATKAPSWVRREWRVPCFDVLIRL